MDWLREITRILRRARVKFSLAPMYGTSRPVVALMLEGVSWTEVEEMVQALNPSPSPVNGRGEEDAE